MRSAGRSVGALALLCLGATGALVAGPRSGGADTVVDRSGEAYCQDVMNQAVAACIAKGDPYHGGRSAGQADFSYIARCKADHQKDYDNCIADMRPGACGPRAQQEAKINIDWVLQKDAGAQAQYRKFRANGQAPVDAVISAQAHNPHAQQTIRQCRDWAARYIAGLPQPAPPAPPPGPMSRRQLTRDDCRCISILPTGNPDAPGRPSYRVTNRCDLMQVAVQFKGTIGATAGDLGFSYTADAGAVGDGGGAVVQAPAWSLISIGGYTLKNSGSSVSCPTN